MVVFAFVMVLVLVLMFMFVFMSVHVIFVGMLVMVILMVVIVFVLMRMFVVMFMLVHVLIFFNTVYDDMRMCAFDAALDALFEVICDTGNAQRIELILTGFYAARKLGKRCEEHVACCAHIAFDIKSLHGLTSDVVDHAGRVARTESVVDINDRDTART